MKFCVHCGDGLSEVPNKGHVQCPGCEEMIWRNPRPAVACVVPVQMNSGEITLLGVRKAEEPALGKIVFPGGFVDLGEVWQVAARREIWEETTIQLSDSVPVEHPSFFDPFFSLEGGSVIVLLASLPMQYERDLPAFQPNVEISERYFIEPETPLGFNLHESVRDAYFRTLNS